MKSLLIDESADKELEALKERLNRPKKQIIEQLIRYANVLKIDPAYTKEGDPSHEIRKTRNDLIAFIKTQEKDHLKPLYDQLRVLVGEHQKTSQSLLTRADYQGMEKTMVDNQKSVYKMIQELKQSIESNEQKRKADSNQKHVELDTQIKNHQNSMTMQVADLQGSQSKLQKALVEAQAQVSKDLKALKEEKAALLRSQVKELVLQFIRLTENQKNLVGNSYTIKGEQLAELKRQIEGL